MDHAHALFNVQLKILQAGWLRDGTWPEGAVAPSWDETRPPQQRQHDSQNQGGNDADQSGTGTPSMQQDPVPSIPPGYTPSPSSGEQGEWIEQGKSNDYTQLTPPPGAECGAWARGDDYDVHRKRGLSDEAMEEAVQPRLVRTDGHGGPGARSDAQKRAHEVVSGLEEPAGKRVQAAQPMPPLTPPPTLAGSDDDESEEEQEEEELRAIRILDDTRPGRIRIGDGRAEGG